MASKKTDPRQEKNESLKETSRDAIRTAEALSTHEVVQRFGSATAEYIKGYRGLDNESGVRFAKGLAGVAKHKVNDNYATQNIKQQAGFSAEIATTSRDNAEAIIRKSNVRASRSDDLYQYGKNHNVVDRVQLVDGKVIEGSQAQMKFVGNRDDLFDKIARENGKFARYRGVKLELPTEQFEGDKASLLEAQELRERAEKLKNKASDNSTRAEEAKKMFSDARKLERDAKSADSQAQSAPDRCRSKAQEARYNANKAEKDGNSSAAAKLRSEADNYDKLADDIHDSGLTTEDAIYYRENPGTATLRDIGRTAHGAGLQGAKYGAIIGGSISVLMNCWAVAQGEKEVSEALPDVALDTVKTGALGYATAFAGSAIKGGMQQSSNQFTRQLASTSGPALAINICLSLGSTVNRFVTGEIDEAQLLTEVGEKGAGMLASGMMAAAGQVAIPIPFLGAAVGGMIGYTISSMFYQSALDAARGAKISSEQLLKIRSIEAAARERIALEQEQLEKFISREIPQLQLETKDFLSALSEVDCKDTNALSESINHYAELLGKSLQFNSIDEFETFMSSDNSLKI
ncbi:hypothetical protein [Halomonas sp. hl-4]|uniref:hypothetical protein n=1 Tax=Halomonas sp. hl-4 TaxID=1761789 RepID=UPI000BB9124A|nr:hypothetical protein [Halomonas sp. hl-4]SNY97917.1 hypothetical protein SAMN04488142_2526 [Halomonas sp. hl-4]